MALVNIEYIDQISEFTGNSYHYSGWGYVLQNLASISGTDPSLPLCDCYLERTFLWRSNPYIPYTVPWIGFLHHTFDTTFSDLNLTNLFKSQDFITSLDSCKGLFVLTTYLQTQVEDALADIGFPDMPVLVVTHPTITPSNLFNMKKFAANSEQSLVSIGNWLRKPFDIYLATGVSLNKKVLQGYNMEDTAPPKDFFRFFKPSYYKEKLFGPSDIDDIPLQRSLPIVKTSVLDVNCTIPDEIFNNLYPIPIICRGQICRNVDPSLNKFVQGVIEHLKDLMNDVETIPYLINEEYDELLSQNIVFLSLVDGSAVNTLLECVVRNTPVIVNKIDSVVELLGDDYPLYFTELTDVASLVDTKVLTKAHVYLKNLDKTKLDIAYFISDFSTKVKSLL